MNQTAYSSYFPSNLVEEIPGVGADRIVRNDFRKACISIEESVNKLKNLISDGKPTIGSPERDLAFQKILELEELTKRYANQNIRQYKNLYRLYLNYFLLTVHHINPQFYDSLSFDKRDELFKLLNEIDMLEAHSDQTKTRLGNVTGFGELNVLHSRLNKFIAENSKGNDSNESNGKNAA